MQRRAAAAYVAFLGLFAVAAVAALLTDAYPDRTAEFWAVGILTGTTAVILLASAYMPNRL